VTAAYSRPQPEPGPGEPRSDDPRSDDPRSDDPRPGDPRPGDTEQVSPPPAGAESDGPFAGPEPGSPQPGAAGPDGARPADVVVGEPRRRLHPLSPLLSGAKSIAVIVAALSWQTLSQVGVERFALVVAVVAVGVVIFSVIGWLNTGYHIVGRELRIQDGLLWRRNRAIPLDRLQAVELRRPLLAQLTGLAELRLEVVGGGKTEAPLAYLTVREAAALRQRLLALAGRTPGVPEPGGTEPAAGPPALERPLFRVSNRDLLISQLLTPQAFLLPVGVAFVVMQFVLEGSWTFVGIASTVTAMAGVLLQPVRRVLQDWDFRLARDPDGRLAVRYGLLETRSQIVPLHRVQSIGVTWPLLWRAKGWLHMRLDIAGYAGPQSNNDKRSDRLLPVGVFAAGRELVWEVLPGVDLATLATLPPPDRARWLHPFALRSFGAGLTPEVFVSRSGLLTRELTMVPYARLQSVRVVQGPLQRMLGLATVYADTAGGRSGVAQDRDLAEAWWFAEQLSTRARRARGMTPAPAASQPALPESLPVEHPAAPPVPAPPEVAGPASEDDAYWQRPPRS
jgi:putative membrane protein